MDVEVVTDAADSEVSRWVAEFARYERDAGSWHERSRKIVKRYKDERSNAEENRTRFNILWSNIRTMMPACYMRNPKPQVERRFKDKDPVARAASEVLERCLVHQIDACDFKSLVRQALLDRFLPGRGTLWVRYVPHMKDMAVMGTNAVESDGVQTTDDAPTPEVAQEVAYEEVAIDYVHWEDFGHTAARTYDEMGAAWRKVYLTREELVKRFGEEIGKAIPLTWKQKAADGKDRATNIQAKGVIYEVWDKTTKTALWVCKDYPKLCDKRADPLKLSRFFPFPRPLFATLANDSLIPVPDYREYQDQARELDNLTTRIDMLTRAVKVAGVHDASAPAIARLLNEGVQNQLVGVDQWAAFAEKGGLKGAMEFLPMEEIAKTLIALYDARDRVKNDLYEITGMPDIIRGANDPRSTATAERIKGQYGSIRMQDMQAEVQTFVRDLLNVMGEVTANHFGWQTLATISGIQLLSTQQKAQAQAMQQAAAQGAPVPPMDPEMAKLLDEPAWEEVEALLRDNCHRSFRIDIETDSTIGEDEQIEQEQRIAMVKTLGEFMAQAVQAAENTPQIAPIAAELMMYVVRSFKNARTLEGTLEEAAEKLADLAKNPQPPKPDPEQSKAQAQIAIIQAQAKTDSDQAAQKAQFDMQLQAKKQADAKELEQYKADLAASVTMAQQQAQQRQAEAQNAIEAQREMLQAHLQAQADQVKAFMDAQTTKLQGQIDLLIAQMNNAAKVEVAEIAAETTLQAAQTTAANQASED